LSQSWFHILPAQTEAAKGVSLTQPEQLLRQPVAPFEANPLVVPSPPLPSFYPADMTFHGGHVVTSAVSTDVFVNCASGGTCWGNPGGFLNDLGKSTFIHVVDQYVHVATNNRYTLNSTFFTLKATGHTFFSRADIDSVAHSAAKLGGGGYGRVYHIYLPKGTDTCADPGETMCYSPDVPSVFVLCAYHSSDSFSDVGKVLFSVEPFQDIPGCAVAAPSPNGQLADSTNSALSHELFETLTDPDGTAWFTFASLPEAGNEIGDICHGVANSVHDEIVPTFLINGKRYEVQLEYSNTYHACASTR